VYTENLITKDNCCVFPFEADLVVGERQSVLYKVSCEMLDYRVCPAQRVRDVNIDRAWLVQRAQIFPRIHPGGFENVNDVVDKKVIDLLAAAAQVARRCEIRWKSITPDVARDLVANNGSDNPIAVFV
jgi:hypothetical protein